MKNKYNAEIVEAFILGKNNRDIAKKSGLSEKTVYRYLKDEEFQMLLSERKKEYIQSSVNKMQSIMYECVEKLYEIINDSETPKSTQVTAIQTVFNQCKEWTGMVDVLNRLEEIENTLHEGGADDSI